LIRGACAYKELWREKSTPMTIARFPGDGWLHSGLIAAFNNDGTPFRCIRLDNMLIFCQLLQQIGSLCLLGHKSCLLRLSDQVGDFVFVDRMGK
jgi:acyl-CoA synthetase (AMP-forming)/AMP-acid ligase II